jgi:hypothetical protein
MSIMVFTLVFRIFVVVLLQHLRAMPKVQNNCFFTDATVNQLSNFLKDMTLSRD